jgi:lysozyme family protein
MSKYNFDSCFATVLAHEGGYVDHPADPGGATNFGITQRTYNAWRARQTSQARSVKKITRDEVEAIYRDQYWNAVRGDDLPAGIDLVVFDFAVNSGPRRAIQHLQAALGIKQDGHIGNVTIRAAQEAQLADHEARIINAITASRLAFVKRLSTWSVFGRGWSRRYKDVEAKALLIELLADEARAKVTPTSTTGTAARVPLPAPTSYQPDAAAPPADAGQNAGNAGSAGWLAGAGAAAATAAQTAKGLLPDGLSANLVLGILIFVALAAAYAVWQSRKAALAAQA